MLFWATWNTPTRTNGVLPPGTTFELFAPNREPVHVGCVASGDRGSQEAHEGANELRSTDVG